MEEQREGEAAVRASLAVCGCCTVDGSDEEGNERRQSGRGASTAQRERRSGAAPVCVPLSRRAFPCAAAREQRRS
jgi:hypothetical protein